MLEGECAMLENSSGFCVRVDDVGVELLMSARIE